MQANKHDSTFEHFEVQSNFDDFESMTNSSIKQDSTWLGNFSETYRN